MTTAASCTADAVHVFGRRVDLDPYGTEPGGWRRSGRCGDCGVTRGGWHHPGCDLQRCPLCRGQMLSCGCPFDEDRPDTGEDDVDDDDLTDVDGWSMPYGVDGNGAPTELISIAGMPVIVHYADVPDHDLTTIDGIRCTTALRTVIDLACEVDDDHLQEMVIDCLDRRLFTTDDAYHRLGESDLATHRGAERVHRVLQRYSG